MPTAIEETVGQAVVVRVLCPTKDAPQIITRLLVNQFIRSDSTPSLKGAPCGVNSSRS